MFQRALAAAVVLFLAWPSLAQSQNGPFQVIPPDVRVGEPFPGGVRP
jgi:hypothetical protein